MGFEAPLGSEKKTTQHRVRPYTWLKTTFDKNDDKWGRTEIGRAAFPWTTVNSDLSGGKLSAHDFSTPTIFLKNPPPLF